MIKAVIFDMDGVISDTNNFHSEIESKIFKSNGILLSPKEITEKYAGMSDKEFFKTVFDKFGKKVNVDEIIEEKWDKLLKHAKGKISGIDGINELVKELKDIKCKLGVASASRKEFIELVLSELNIRNRFDSITSSYEVKLGKPNPDIFLLTSRKLRVTPNECLVIEDGKLGITAAKRANMKCIWIDWNNGNDTVEADKVVRNLTDISISMIQSLSE